jgi:RHS repeat-associated protein
MNRKVNVDTVINSVGPSGGGMVWGVERGNKFFELVNHLGNVLATVSDKKRAVQNGTTGIVSHFVAEVVTAQDYYSFGMMMPGRKFSMTAGAYRYGFNGKENDKDAGEGIQDYGMRIYDRRLGRFLSEDPITKKYPMLTPYQFASNTPIQAIDLDGLEASYFNLNITSNNARLLFRIVNATAFGKQFLTALHKQTSVDVYYYTFKNEEINAGGDVYNPTSFSEGFLIGGVKGQTNFVKNKKELENAMKTDNFVSNVNPQDLEESFKKGKSVVLIGIAEEFLNKIDEIANQQKIDESLPEKNGWTKGKIQNLIADAAHTLQHEQMAHGLENITTNDNKSDPFTDHKNYNNVLDTYSPNTWELFTKKEYKGSKAQKSLSQILNVMLAYYNKKDEKPSTTQIKSTKEE